MRRINLDTAIAAIVSLGTLVTPQVSYGGSISYGDLTHEMLMGGQLQAQLLIQAAIPWEPTDTVIYDYVFDASTGAFRFATILDQSTGGLPFLSTIAQGDPSDGSWSWSGTGLAEGASLQITGEGSFTGELELRNQR